jgi:tetratricopeptide (TPR) repeat protein
VSFFKKLFGGGSFEDERAEGDRLYEAGAFQEARIAYQRALDRPKDAAEDALERCRSRIAECLDRMAEARIEEAARLTEEGNVELAEAELRNAIETAASEEIARRGRRALEALEQADALRQAEVPDEMSDEDRWALLTGNWENEQLDEYDELGEPFRDAMLALHDGRVEEARAALEAMVDEDACYLWLEIGRARVLAEDVAGAEEALRTFLEALDEDEGGEARLSAHAELASLRDREGDEEGAMAELEAAMEAFPDDPRPFYLMGRYLRSKGHDAEAADVIEAALPLLDEDRPDWRFFEEIGLAKAALDEDEEAAMYLDRVIAFFVQVRRPDAPHVDFPPVTAVARAKLHEKAGELEKAADLYRALAHGSDREGHLAYHREAARILLALELVDEGRRMLTRALALAEEDAEARAAIEAQLAELE